MTTSTPEQLQAHNTEDQNVISYDPMVTPGELKARLPVTPAAAQTVLEARRTVRNILRGEDQRLLVIVGPCSVHDEEQALVYARRLAQVREQVKDRLEVVMRVYVEKPRTTVGWRGFLVDPDMDGSFDMSKGLERTRDLMLKVNELGVPVATELLDPFVPQYLYDLLSWGCIGARTVESQTHRVMASAVSAPMGFKNGTGGTVKIAVDAIVASSQPHAFFTITDEGKACIVNTRGNPDGHVILRGGKRGPNFEAANVADTEALMEGAGLVPSIVMDCSHANSGSDHTRQRVVWNDVLSQRAAGTRSLRGVMIESNLNPGKQAIPADLSQLQYGVSVTDACIGWQETEELLLAAHAAEGR